MNISLIGPSGSGKGTHTGVLAAEFGLRCISTGDLLHDNLQGKTALGLLARKYMNRGDLVPDEVVDAMVEEWIETVPTADGLLFDGFPRTLYQAKFLEEMLRAKGRTLDAVVYLKVPDEIAIDRLSGRQICSTCNAPFHLSLKPAARANVCDLCGGVLVHRPEDSPEMVQSRLKTFHRTIDEVLHHYQANGLLVIQDAGGASHDVSQSLVGTLRLIRQRGLRPASLEQLHALKAPKPVILLPGQVNLPSLDLVLLGGPGSGKGTQAEHLCRELAIPHISTGDLFRENLKNGSALGKMAKSYMDRGELVPDNVTEAMVEQRLGDNHAGTGFVLDGFPRNLAQAQALDEILTEAGRRLSGAIFINVSDEEITHRLSGRRICSCCQAPYHVSFKPPRSAGVCDQCGGALCQRDDDNPTTIKARLKTFHAQIRPLLDYYNERGLLLEVNGEGAAPEVTQRTLAAAKSVIPEGALYV